MFVITKEYNMLGAGESEYYIKEDELNFLSANPQLRKEFLERLGADRFELNPIMVKGDTLVELPLGITVPPKMRWGCSHTINKGVI